MKDLIIFETNRLVAREWSTEIAEQAIKIYGDAEVTRFIGGIVVKDLDEMRARIGEIKEKYRNLKPGMGSFPMFLKSTGEMVGTALIKPMPFSEGNLSDDIEIGWHLGKAYWGFGYATEWGKKLLEYGFQDLGLDELHAVVNPLNAKSLEVAKRVGLQSRGQTSKYYDNETVEHFVMARHDWLDQNADTP